MAATDPDTAPRPFVYRLPIMGAIAREWAEGDPDYPFVLLAALLSAWACAIVLWGLPALYLPAVAAAPGMLIMLVLLTRG